MNDILHVYLWIQCQLSFLGWSNPTLAYDPQERPLTPIEISANSLWAQNRSPIFIDPPLYMQINEDDLLGAEREKALKARHDLYRVFSNQAPEPEKNEIIGRIRQLYPIA